MKVSHRISSALSFKMVIDISHMTAFPFVNRSFCACGFFYFTGYNLLVHMRLSGKVSKMVVNSKSIKHAFI